MSTSLAGLPPSPLVQAPLEVVVLEGFGDFRDLGVEHDTQDAQWPSWAYVEGAYVRRFEADVPAANAKLKLTLAFAGGWDKHADSLTVLQLQEWELVSNDATEGDEPLALGEHGSLDYYALEEWFYSDGEADAAAEYQAGSVTKIDLKELLEHGDVTEGVTDAILTYLEVDEGNTGARNALMARAGEWFTATSISAEEVALVLAAHGNL